MTPAEREVLMDRPAIPPPPGVVSNLENPESVRSWGLPLQIAILVIVTLLVAAWMFTKMRIVKKVFVDDYIIFLAYLLFIPLMIFSFLMSNSGLGAHLWDLRMRTRIHLSYLYNQATIIYLLLMPILRSGITLQIIRTFVPLGTRNAVFWTGHVLIWLNLLIYFATIVVEFKMCSPRAKKWDPTITGGSCSRGALAVRFFVAFLNVASDVVLLVIPQRAIWRLRMGWGGKGRLSVLFLFGLFSMTCGCIQINVGINMSKWTAQSDKSAEIAQSQLWAMLEVLGGFLVACLPVMPKFLKATWHAVSGSAIGAAFASAFTTRFSSFSGEKGGQSEKKGAQEARGSDEVVLTIGRRRERHIGVDAQFRDLLESRDSAELGLGLGGAADRSKESKESSISLTRPAPCQLRDDV